MTPAPNPWRRHLSQYLLALAPLALLLPLAQAKPPATQPAPPIAAANLQAKHLRGTLGKPLGSTLLVLIRGGPLAAPTGPSIIACEGKNVDSNLPLFSALPGGKLPLGTYDFYECEGYESGPLDNPSPVNRAFLITKIIDAKSSEAPIITELCEIARENPPQSLTRLETLLKAHPELINAVQGPYLHRTPSYEDDFTPLLIAARWDHADIAAALIAYGAELNTNIVGHTPLHYAAQNGNLPLVKLLITHGADTRAKTPAIPQSTSDDMPNPASPPSTSTPPTIYPAVPAKTALDLARESNHPDVVHYLETLPH